jgi:hypothetical protein
MFYEDLKKLRPVEFKRYCGVKPKTFERMVAVVGGYQKKRRRKSGRPPKLSPRRSDIANTRILARISHLLSVR